MSVLELLAQSSFIMFNKPLARKIGIDEAILIGSLSSLQVKYGNEEFFCEQSKLMEDTCLTEYRLRNATKTLKDKNIISINKKGLPAKYYYKVNEEVILSYLTTSGAKFDTTGGVKSDTTINYNTSIYTNIYIKNKINNKLLCANTKFKNKPRTFFKLKPLTSKQLAVVDIFNYWNSKEIIVHKQDYLKEPVVKIIKQSINSFGSELIKICIDRYKQILEDKAYFFKYKWSLKDFLSRKEGISSFLDDGSKWLSYQNFLENESNRTNYSSKNKIQDTSKIDNNGVISL